LGLTQVPDTAVFSVEIVFYLTTDHSRRVDLDNLAKPVLDTLFLPRHAQVKDRSLTGALIEIDDSRVHRLVTEKRIVSAKSEEGLDAAVTWE
jgi:Holliday junction resolvase RusA-like endonuclease